MFQKFQAGRRFAGQVSGSGGITESHTYNSSLESTSTKATSTAGTALSLSLNYNLSGGDNGSVTNITNNVDNGRTQTIAYDPLNRILSAASSATSGADCWGQVFGPDGKAGDDIVANLININSGTQTQPTCPLGRLNITVDGNNHINSSSSFVYDAAGNMTQDATPGVLYSFDAENRLYKVAGVTGGPYCYVYDGNGLRVAKKSGANSDCTGGTIVKLYWRSLSGDAVAETDSTGSTTNSAYNEYVFFAGRRVGSRNGTGTIFYWFADQLGTTRSITTGNGPGQTTGQLCYDADFTPYGQEMSHNEHLQAPAACPPNYKFTGYERDPETGLDYAFARYYSSSLGRFYSTDPLGGSIGSLQSHNAYAYAGNNPTNYSDPSGMEQVNCTINGADGFCPWLRGGGGGGGGGGYPIYMLFTGSYEDTVDENGDPTEVTVDWGEWVIVGYASYVGFGNSGGGGGAPKKYTVDLKVLNDCLSKMGIKTTISSLTPSTPGGYGAASGTGEDTFSGHGNTVPITVTNDAHTYNAAQVGKMCNLPFAYGCTDPMHPYTNYTNNNNSAFGTVDTQVWELGNSLWQIQAGSVFVPWPSEEPGKTLENCVRTHNGIQGQ